MYLSLYVKNKTFEFMSKDSVEYKLNAKALKDGIRRKKLWKMQLDVRNYKRYN